MNLLSQDMEQTLEGGSLIRKMFETGNVLRAKYGADAVCDFSLGNPDLAPPASIAKALHALADKVHEPASLGYMSNAGFAWARQTLAEYLSKEQNILLSEEDVLLTCGAAGGMQVFFRSVLNEGDTVLGISPYFVEYNKYVSCNGGTFVPVPSLPDTFTPDIKAMAAAINASTRAILINSPNNPTGAVYSAEDVKALAKLAEEASKKYGRTVYLVSDEPYRFLTYDGVTVSSLLDISANAVVLGSFSKSLALAGERVGYIALSPLLENREHLMAGLVQANRFLGFVNAPIVGQYLMEAGLKDPNLNKVIEETKAVYIKRRAMLAEILQKAGIEFMMPKGTFYFFLKSPVQNEDIFVDALKEEKILAVQGRGFGCPGYVRLSFAVTERTIEQSEKGFIKVAQELRG